MNPLPLKYNLAKLLRTRSRRQLSGKSMNVKNEGNALLPNM